MVLISEREVISHQSPRGSAEHPPASGALRRCVSYSRYMHVPLANYNFGKYSASTTTEVMHVQIYSGQKSTLFLTFTFVHLLSIKLKLILKITIFHTIYYHL